MGNEGWPGWSDPAGKLLQVKVLLFWQHKWYQQNVTAAKPIFFIQSMLWIWRKCVSNVWQGISLHQAQRFSYRSRQIFHIYFLSDKIMPSADFISNRLQFFKIRVIYIYCVEACNYDSYKYLGVRSKSDLVWPLSLSAYMPWRLMSSSPSCRQCWCSCLRCSQPPPKKPTRLLLTLCGQLKNKFFVLLLLLLLIKGHRLNFHALCPQCDHTYSFQMPRGGTGTLPALFC